MRTSQRRLSLNHEIVREIGSQAQADVAGGQIQTLKGCNLTIPPTFCGCTGTETYTGICCINQA